MSCFSLPKINICDLLATPFLRLEQRRSQIAAQKRQEASQQAESSQGMHYEVRLIDGRGHVLAIEYQPVMDEVFRGEAIEDRKAIERCRG